MTGRAGAGSGACKGLTVAAPASGSGKTTLTLGLLRRLAGQGVAVASAKAGPDYIDPAFHAAASGRPCLNLDAWAMRPETLGLAAARLATDATVIVCEGVMGLFDGAIVGDAENRHKNDDCNDGSTAALSRITGWPVVLVVDAAAQGASAAAVVKGFAEFRPGVRIAGVVFNRVGGDRHAAILKESCRAALPEVPVLGCLPRAAGVELPERHLGLVQAGEHPDLESFLESAARLVAEHVDVDALLSLARPFASSINDPASPSVASSVAPPIPPLGQRIAVARDRAFAFAYPLVIDGWRAAGAEVTTFSPLADEAPEATADAVYLPGGYPELHGGKLAAAARFLAGLRARAEAGAVLYGECGGYMVLGRGLTDGHGRAHAMAGLLPVETSFASPKLHLGYRQARLPAAGPLGAAGAAYRGHEFHYAAIAAEGPGQPLFEAADAQGRGLGPAGLRAGSVMGSFIHLIDRR